MMNTLCCQLLTAWTLKLPMWAKDIMEAAREGDLPYIAAIGLCGDLLKGHPVARRALRNPYLATSDAGLVALTQTLATNINVVVPELNLGVCLAPSLCLCDSIKLIRFTCTRVNAQWPVRQPAHVLWLLNERVDVHVAMQVLSYIDTVQVWGFRVKLQCLLHTLHCHVR